uniref:PBPe domain-containing protein n=1 Tax=Macrostomum lignano TaxID=282301 RepID=A0A1I8FHQ3_9PLAT
FIFTVARFSPFEWYNPHACHPDSDVVENQFNITNSLWFTIGSLMQQGSEMAPRANSTRIVSGSWWFFTLIMISSYTANLAAFLTVKRMKSPIENVEDLSKQNEIMYGILEGGSTFHFFQKATIPTYKSMFDFMSSNSAKCFVKSTPEGIERVLNENYAFILESTWNEYYTQRNCKLMQVGGLLDSKGYGIGMPAGSPYVDVFSETILELQKSQAIESLRQKWWRKFNISKPCDDTDGPSGNRHPTNALGLEQIGGAFIILTAGMLLSVLCAGVEFCFKHIKHSVSVGRTGSPKGAGSLCANMWEEVKFAVQCCVSSKRRASRGLPDEQPQLAQQPLQTGRPADGASAVAAFVDAQSASYSLGQLSRPDTLLSAQLASASSFGHRQQQQQHQRPPKYNDCVPSTQL